MVETHGLYALNARTAAEIAGAGFIDLSNLSVAYFETAGRDGTKADYLWLSPEDANARFPEGVEDNTHFTALGACGVAYVIATALEETGYGAPLIDSSRIGAAVDPDSAEPRPPAVISCAENLAWETVE